MFESFRTICYLPLAIFAIGWFLAQLLYSKWKEPFTRMENWEQMQKTFLKSNSNILLMCMLQIVFLLVGIYLGKTLRWFLLGLEFVLIMVYVIRIGATMDFLRDKQTNEEWIRLTVLPIVLQLACTILSGLWMIYIFLVAGLF